jgi:hypothetical protein
MFQAGVRSLGFFSRSQKERGRKPYPRKHVPARLLSRKGKAM